MLKTLYEPLSGNEEWPLDEMFAGEAREMTFRIEDRHGVRYDQALLAKVPPGKIDWLWPGRIPCGRVTLIEGPGGVGKSTLALDFVSRVCDDRPWPDGAPQARTGGKAVIICRQDDAADVVGARLQAMGAPPDRYVQFHAFESMVEDMTRYDLRPVSLPDDLPVLERLLERDKSIRLVVIDALSDFCTGKKALAELIHRLNRFASFHQVAIVVTLRANCRFDRQGQPVVKSRHDTEAARCAWCCVSDPEDPGRNLFLPTLMNYT